MAALVFSLFICVDTGTAIADEDDVIDQCWLDNNDVLHCSTPNRRAAQIDKMLMTLIHGYNIDEREQYLLVVARAWLKRQSEPCHSAEISIQNIFNAYNAPGKDDGTHIADLEDKCERLFATWLFKKENHGMSPGEVARVNTVVLDDIDWAKSESRGCRKEANKMVDSARKWLATEKALDSEKRKDPSSEETKTAERNTDEKYAEKESAVKALNDCIDKREGKPDKNEIRRAFDEAYGDRPLVLPK